jgi:hypothetical protein
MGKALVLVALIAVGATPAADRFNLVCKGMHAHSTINAGRQVEPWSETYRIDLAAKVYCTDVCKGRAPLADITPAAISFWPTKNDETPTEKTSSGLGVSRETGKLVGVMSFEDPRVEDSIILDEWDANCTKAPFSGFPLPPSTKF